MGLRQWSGLYSAARARNLAKEEWSSSAQLMEIYRGVYRGLQVQAMGVGEAMGVCHDPPEREMVERGVCSILGCA